MKLQPRTDILVIDGMKHEVAQTRCGVLRVFSEEGICHMKGLVDRSACVPVGTDRWHHSLLFTSVLMIAQCEHPYIDVEFVEGEMLL